MLNRMITRIWIGALAFLLMLTVYVPAIYSNPLPSVSNVFNGLFFKNSEVLIDVDESNTVTPGDVFWGVMDLQNIINADNDPSGQTGSDIWPVPAGSSDPVPPAEISAYFIVEVVETIGIGEIGSSGIINPFDKELIILGALDPDTTFSDPNNVFSDSELRSGAVIKVYEDSANNFNDSSKLNAINTATDGTELWTLGIEGGYWYTVAPVVPPGFGDVGVSYAGLNFLTPGQYGLVNDPDEDFSDGSGHKTDPPNPADLDVELFFNSEIFALDIDGDGIGNFYDEDHKGTLMHFGSNDPAVYKPIVEEEERCRVTAGGVEISEDEMTTLACSLKPNGKPNPKTCAVENADGSSFRDTWGGQAGASGIDGNWTHHHQVSPHESFVFHSNDVTWIECSDPGIPCTPAGANAETRQIDFKGFGRFSNQKGFTFPEGVDLGFWVHLEDIGEPGPGGRWPSAPGECTHIPGTIINGDPECSEECVDCINCTDYYEIRIYSTKEFDVETDVPIYVNGTPGLLSPLGGYFITSGNVQMHPGK